jgi:hypothetical protein
MRAKRWLRLRTVLFALIASCVLAGAAAADTVPWIPGGGNDEDSPGVVHSADGGTVPVLHVHVFSHWVGFVQSIAPQRGYVDCPSACARPVAPGTQVTLFAQKNLDDTGAGGLHFARWTGDVCEGVTSQTCTFTMPAGDASVDVTAVFAGVYVAPDPVAKKKNSGGGEQPPPGDGCGKFCE